MLLAMLAALAVLTDAPAKAGPTPASNPATWVTPDDYPAQAMLANASGDVGFSLQVAADGSVSGCSIIASSTNELLDRTTCSLVSARAKFLPARDSHGQAVPSIYTSAVRWTQSGGESIVPIPCPPDAGLPAGARCAIRNPSKTAALPVVTVSMINGALDCSVRLDGIERHLTDDSCTAIAKPAIDAGRPLPMSTPVSWPGSLPLKPPN